MSEYDFDKRKFEYFKRHFLAPLQPIKANASCRWMVNVHRIGNIQDGFWHYSLTDKQAILSLVEAQLGVSIYEQYPDKQSRVDNAAKQAAEKTNALAVSHDFILVNCIEGLKLNNNSANINMFNTLGLQIDAASIETVEHSYIVLVENLAVMARLKELVLSKHCAHLKDALWLYRGDVKEDKSTSAAYRFFRKFQESHQLYCFADFDPSGLQIAITSYAHKMIIPGQGYDFKKELGPEIEYYQQQAAQQFLSRQNNLSNSVQRCIEQFNEKKLTLQQEHMIAHRVVLTSTDIFTNN